MPSHTLSLFTLSLPLMLLGCSAETTTTTPGGAAGTDAGGSSGQAGQGGGGSAGDSGSSGQGGAAGSAGSSGQAGSGGAAPDCFTPTPASGGDSFVAKDGDNKRSFEFTLPADPEGGYVTVDIQGSQLFAGLRVKGASEGSFEGGSSGDGGKVSLGFAGEPGVTYVLDLEETSVSATDEERTVSFTWKLATILDCYEPNDTPTQAKPIALGQTIKPYMFAGYISTDHEWPTMAAHYDYFEVTVDKASTLSVTLQPEPVSMSVDLFAASAPETSLGGAFTIEEAVTVTASVEPGKYLIRVQPFSSLYYSSSLGDCTHCTPYTLSTTLE